ncbi:MAG: GNAT family N-acetyltransferase [Lachnospiraceae bacterium]|nr:GNAT family N-acetyltransferase [Lachnospiraceae bacterium]
MNNKEKYGYFCRQTYVPVYSKPWWMDAICGKDNWDVWLYEKGNNILAAMPYYLEQRGRYRYITKAPLTQNNGIIFNYPDDNTMKIIAKQKFEEEIILKACTFIEEFGLDVYEQQYQYSFKYFLPFFWNNYVTIPRVTYVLEDTSDIEKLWESISSKYRNKIKKGQKNSIVKQDLDKTLFYIEHEKVFKKQNLECPFSYDLWDNLYEACKINNSGKILYASSIDGNIASLLFLVWDEKSMYQLLGGSIPEYQKLQSYNLLTWEAVKIASRMGLKYDFEGSVIERISKSFREFGGKPEIYYRIRKVFNPEILEKEYNIQHDILLKKNNKDFN